jgi:CubicO group peptidase (beta-lactamase class C family)
MNFFKGIKTPMPHLNLMPTGGVTLINAGDWLKSGACAVGVGSALLDARAIEEENYSVLTENAKILKQNIDSVKANIKIADVLSMSSGLSGDELTDQSEYNFWVVAPDQLSYTLNKPMINIPGDYFNYNNGTAHFTSAIISKAAGSSTIQFATDNLFKPMAIETPAWEVDKQGINNGAAGLSLTPTDMLKIGKLYLNKGIFDGTRIVSEEWVTKASTFKISTHNIEPFGPEYGYLWWIGSNNRHSYFFANGYGGQFIVVVPDLDLIVVATNKWSGVSLTTANQQWYSTLRLIMDRIIPAFESE